MKAIRKTTVKTTPTSTVRNLAFFVEADLVTEIKNWLASQYARGDWTFPSFSFFIRASIVAYSRGEIKFSLPTAVASVRKQEISVRLPVELFNLYKTWPITKRTTILQACLRNYFILQTK